MTIQKKTSDLLNDRSKVCALKLLEQDVEGVAHASEPGVAGTRCALVLGREELPWRPKCRYVVALVVRLGPVVDVRLNKVDSLYIAPRNVVVEVFCRAALLLGRLFHADRVDEGDQDLAREGNVVLQPGVVEGCTVPFLVRAVVGDGCVQLFQPVGLGFLGVLDLEALCGLLDGGMR